MLTSQLHVTCSAQWDIGNFSAGWIGTYHQVGVTDSDDKDQVNFSGKQSIPIIDRIVLDGISYNRARYDVNGKGWKFKATIIKQEKSLKTDLIGHLDLEGVDERGKPFNYYGWAIVRFP